MKEIKYAVQLHAVMLNYVQNVYLLTYAYSIIYKIYIKYYIHNHEQCKIQ